MDAHKIGGQIARLRKKENMTQLQLAERLFVTEKAVSKWECGNGLPDLDNIGKLAEIFNVSIDELLMAEEKDKREATSDEQILQLWKGNSPLVNCYEDIVVYSSHLSNALINQLANEFIDSITQFEEIFYLLDYFTQETLQKLCLYHKDKITEDTDLSLLLGQIDNSSFLTLCECRRMMYSCEDKDKQGSLCEG